ncbi:amino acid permease-domain-containing protein [Chytriomyces sp. MP71]|nr:amino acid permease-domain-containing protein [Chytriomyces sp. MP71]
MATPRSMGPAGAGEHEAPKVNSNRLDVGVQPLGVASRSGLQVHGRNAKGLASHASLAASKASIATRQIMRAVHVEYEEKDQSYFDKRKLNNKSLGMIHLFVATYAVLSSGTGAGWWTGTTSAGWGTVLVCVAVMTVWMVSFGVVLSELMTMLPYIGGLATYSRAAFGPYVGYFIGQCELAEYTIFIATNVNAVASDLNSLAGLSSSFVPLWWFIVFGVLFLIMCMKNQYYFSTFGIITFISITFTLSLTLIQLGSADPSRWAMKDFFDNTYNYNVTANGYVPYDYNQALFPAGASGFISTLPFIFGDFQGLEVLPLLAEESRNFEKDGPRAMFLTIVIFQLVYWICVLVTPTLPPGLFVMQYSWDPIVLTFVAWLGADPEGALSNYLYIFFPIIGQLAACMSLTLAFTRLNFAMSRSGLMPQYLSLTEVPFKKESLPWAAFLFSIVTTMFVILISYFAESNQTLENITLALGDAGFYYLTIMYGMTGVSFLYLRHICPNVKRPFKSSLGPLCAVLVIVGCIVLFVFLCYTASARVALALVAGKLVIGMIHFYFCHRKHLVLSEEEKFIAENMGQQVSMNILPIMEEHSRAESQKNLPQT